VDSRFHLIPLHNILDIFFLFYYLFPMTSSNTINDLDIKIKEAAELIKEAHALLLCAGAGAGVDSGLPDFRGNKGFWKAYPPFAKLGHSFIDMANPQWFRRDPELAWGFYGHRLNLYRKTIPHDGFKILLEWGQSKPGGYFVFTSNVDGQFQKAGFSEDLVEECHGSILHFQCAGPCGDAIWKGDSFQVIVNEETMKATPPLPLCPQCHKLARPNILMFGDWNWISYRSDIQQQSFQDWRQENQGKKIVIIEMGAGTAVPTVRMTSERMIQTHNTSLIRINVREPQVPTGHIGLPMGALEALQQIQQLQKSNFS
jgi:NAD-dependent SIR2 family protein deacetylase